MGLSVGADGGSYRAGTGSPVSLSPATSWSWKKMVASVHASLPRFVEIQISEGI